MVFFFFIGFHPFLNYIILVHKYFNLVYIFIIYLLYTCIFYMMHDIKTQVNAQTLQIYYNYILNRDIIDAHANRANKLNFIFNGTLIVRYI